MKKYLISIVIIAFCLTFMMWIFISADCGELPFVIQNMYNFPYGDKIGHLLLIGLITFMIQFSLIRMKGGPIQRKKRIIVTAIIIGLIITLEEFSQKVFSTRNFSFIDLLFSYLGIVLFSFLSGMVRR